MITPRTSTTAAVSPRSPSTCRVFRSIESTSERRVIQFCEKDHSAWLCFYSDRIPVLADDAAQLPEVLSEILGSSSADVPVAVVDLEDREIRIQHEVGGQ